MATAERGPKVSNEGISQKVDPLKKEALSFNNKIREIGAKEKMPVSWDSACRL